MGVSLLTDQTPASPNNVDTNAAGATLATCVRSSVPGMITHVRFYGATDAGGAGWVYKASVWKPTADDASPAAQLLAITYDPTLVNAPGAWNSIKLLQPVYAPADMPYKVAYHTSNVSGQVLYVSTSSALASPITNDVLTAQAGDTSWDNGGSPITLRNGSYKYSGITTYPNDQFSNALYFADLIFEPGWTRVRPQIVMDNYDLGGSGRTLAVDVTTDVHISPKELSFEMNSVYFAITNPTSVQGRIYNTDTQAVIADTGLLDWSSMGSNGSITGWYSLPITCGVLPPGNYTIAVWEPTGTRAGYNESAAPASSIDGHVSILNGRTGESQNAGPAWPGSGGATRLYGVDMIYEVVEDTGASTRFFSFFS